MALAMFFFVPIAVTVIFTTIGVLLGHRFIRPHIGEGHHDVISPIFATVGTIYAVFLAFLVVAVWGSNDSTQANVSSEASALATLYRASGAMSEPSGHELRGLVRAYTTAVIVDEWPVQAASGAASPQARAAALGMYRLFGRIDPQVRQTDSAIDSVALGLITEIQAERNKRTLAAKATLSSMIWLAAIATGALVLVMTFFLYMERVWLHVLMSNVLAVMICALLCITYLFSRPFVGPLALGPDAFVHSIGVYDSVDKTP